MGEESEVKHYITESEFGKKFITAGSRVFTNVLIQLLNTLFQTPKLLCPISIAS